MPDRSVPTESGVLTLRFPIALGRGLPTTELFCERWSFKTDEDLGIAPWQVRGPMMRAWFAVALSAPVSDPSNPGEAASAVLAMIPSTNVLGFAACNKAPQSAVQLEFEESPA